MSPLMKGLIKLILSDVKQSILKYMNVLVFKIEV